ncbi:DUF1272 domain-containing protein [Chengkuizengella axinellae]|uniref:DUF1272 domain-containing protein n=1 Tax=Chengkuizengella axinellae TaxID=3064388 RepID=A0ABT9J375_9BACL|nr:DUF1272 domain-containing protein [Chengkuizengella sp. 2205SS18-9]MDP5276066.1 DUF1272 domain-containing protein [Chengkuizengella sp. 2205SS18-9]
MALEMRTKCEKCEADIQKDGLAFICTHECTFCEKCAEETEHVCPNCSGELVRRPRPNKAFPLS